MIINANSGRLSAVLSRQMRYQKQTTQPIPSTETAPSVPHGIFMSGMLCSKSGAKWPIKDKNINDLTIFSIFVHFSIVILIGYRLYSAEMRSERYGVI
jgi:hypothetical protein